MLGALKNDTAPPLRRSVTSSPFHHPARKQRSSYRPSWTYTVPATGQGRRRRRRSGCVTPVLAEDRDESAGASNVVVASSICKLGFDSGRK